MTASGPPVTDAALFAHEAPPHRRGGGALKICSYSDIRGWATARRGRIRASAGALALVCSLCPLSVAAAPRAAAAQVGENSPSKAVDAAVREALRAYEAALESLDADAVKKVQPSIDVEGLKRAFREMRSLEVDIDNIRVLSADESSARVSCRVAQTLTPKAGSRQATTVTRVLRLRRESSGWVIQAFER